MTVRTARLRIVARRTRTLMWRVAGATDVKRRRSGRSGGTVVTFFDAWQYLDELTEALSGTLREAGIEHLVLPRATRTEPVVAVRRRDARSAIAALAGSVRTRDCRMSPVVDRWLARARPLQSLLLPPTGTGLLISRRLFTPSGHPVVPDGFGVLLDLWEPAGADASGPAAPGTLTTGAPAGVLNRVSAEVWAAAQLAGNRLPPEPPHLLTLTEPVDLVYTWVDGADPCWQAKMRGHQPAPSSDVHSADAAITARFHNRDELRYSLRSVQQYANWARRIWLVTDRQVPSWLVPDERLIVIDHTQIFSDLSALPTFNSHAIESQLHHLAGLADHYVYLNDDVLFARPLRPEAFFHGNGLTKFFPSPALISPYQSDPADAAVDAAAKNNRAFIEATLGRGITNKMRHAPIPQSRALMQEFEDEHPELFDTVMRSRFRHRDDVALVSGLGQYYAFALGRAVPGRIANGYVDLASPVAPDVLQTWLRRRDRDVFCINDSGGPGDPRVPALLERFLAAYYPLPTRWERSGSGGVPSHPAPARPSDENRGSL